MNTKYTSSTSKADYKYIHLVTGDELFVVCDIPKNSFIKASFAMSLQYTVSEEGTNSIVLMPYCPYSETNNIIININTIVSMTNISDMYIDFYKSAIESLLENQTLQDDEVSDITSDPKYYN